MKKLKVYDMKGASVGNYDLADELLVLDKGTQAVHEAVVAHCAHRRAGTASTLRKGEVAGSNKKPWRQKGTGRARAGYRQSPVWRGGSVAFGPHPRDYSRKVNKKVAKLAFRRALSENIAGDGFKVVDEVVLEEGKTRLFKAMMKSLKVSGPVLFVMGKVEKNIELAARNIPNVEVVPAAAVHVYHLLRYPMMVVDRAGMAELTKRLEGKVAQKT